MPSSGGGIKTKLVIDSQTNSVRLSGRSASELLVGDATEQVDLYIATETTITSPIDGGGSNRSGVVRIHDKGSTNGRYVGFEARNRNSGDVRFLNADLSATNKADAVIVCDNGSSLFENARFLNTGGISFNGDTAAANGLDDYEEGTWTPTYLFGGSDTSTYTNRSGSYTKIGNFIFAKFAVDISSRGSGSGRMDIGGLPFTVAGSNAYHAAGCVIYTGSFDWNSTGSLGGITAYYGNAILYFHRGDGNNQAIINNAVDGTQPSGLQYFIFGTTYVSDL